MDFTQDLLEQGIVIEQPELNTGLDDSELNLILDARIRESKTVYEQRKIDERRKTNRQFWLGHQYKEEPVRGIKYMDNIIRQDTEQRIKLANATEYSEEAQDASTSTSVMLSSLGTQAQGDYLLVGSHLPFRGVSIDVDGANGNASVITVKYRKSDNTWADISATDGTASGGASLAQDGTITWTIPSDWLMTTLREIMAADSESYDPNIPHFDRPLYWTRWEWSAALDSSVTLDSMLALNRSTVYGELVSGQVLEQTIKRGVDGIGCIEALTDAGTANLVVNGITIPGGRFS